MKALVHEGAGRAVVRDLPAPARLRPAQSLLRLSRCGLCGTDIGIHAGTHPRAKPGLILGHEFVGEIVETSEDGPFAVGDRAIAFPLRACGRCHPCRTGRPHTCGALRLIGIDEPGGMAELLRVDDALLVPVPPEMPDDIAALVEPLAVAVRAVERARPGVGEPAAVLGAGPIGLLCAIMLRHAGAGEILVSDLDPARLALAADLGFTAVNARETPLAEAVAAATDGEGVGLAVECAGVPAAAAEMTAILRPGGTACLASIHKKPPQVDLLAVNFKELTLIGSRVYSRDEFERAVPLAMALAGPLSQLVTQTVPLAEAAAIFDMVADPALPTVKIMVDCRA